MYEKDINKIGSPSTKQGKIINQQDWKLLDPYCKVYLMGQYDNYYKIGYCSTSIKSRLVPMQSGNPHIIECIFAISAQTKDAAIKLETLLHKKYSEHNVFGEWFYFTPLQVEEYINYISNLTDAINTTLIRELPKEIKR